MSYKDIYLLCKSEEFRLDTGQEASINLKLKKVHSLPCTKLCGQVVSNCTKIQGATVKILGMDATPICHTKTDDDGAFSFINALVPGNYEIIASAEDYLISESRFITLQPSVLLRVTIRLKPDKNAQNAVIYGMVRNSGNIPLPNAQVCVFSNEIAGCPATVTRTNADGEYLFTGLRPGKYVISSLCHGYILPEKVTVEIMPKDIFCADLYLYRDIFKEKGTVSGVVLRDGHAVSYATAALYRKESNEYRLLQIQQANGSGVYLFSDLEAGHYIVTAKQK